MSPVEFLPLGDDRPYFRRPTIFTPRSAHGGATLNYISPRAESPTVLIVDQSEECREVLRTMLQRRGLRTVEATEAAHGLELAREHCPDVIVLDLESNASDESSIRDQFGDQQTRRDASMVILGSLPRAPETARTRFVQKPYHYAPLIRTIEQLLEN